MKAKTFLCSDEQKTEPPAYREELPPRDELCYEEYVYMAVHDLAQGKEPPSVNPTVDVFERVNTAVGKYLIKTLGSYMDDTSLRKNVKKIAKHLAYVANNLDREQSMNATECIVKFIHSTIPPQCHQYLKDPDIRKLFADVVTIVQDRHYVINTSDILAGIVNSAQETVLRSQVLNVTHELVKEILKAMIEVLPVAEICSVEVIQQIAKALSQIPNVDARCLNFMKLSEDAIRHAKENMNDDITLNVVKRFTDMLVSSLDSMLDDSKKYSGF